MHGAVRDLTDPNRVRAILQGIWNFKSAKILDQLLQNLPSDKTIVHLHSYTKALSSSLMPVIMRRGMCLLVTLHSYFISCPNEGHFNYITQESCPIRSLSLQCLLTNCDASFMAHKIWRVNRHITQKEVGGIPDNIKNFIVLSDLSYQVFQQYFPRGAQIFGVPNPIDIAKEPPIEVKDNEAFLMVSRLSKEKGCLKFAEASKIIDCNPVFVGDGEAKEQILGINPKAHVTGWKSHEEVRHWLSQARALVFPSLWYETFGLTVLEAAAKGIPAIVSDGCAARDFIQDGETGFIFQNGNVADLLRDFPMLQDPNLATDMGRQAYERYWENPYTIDRHIDVLDSVYQKLLGHTN